jgi:general secretion pathway protein F
MRTKEKILLIERLRFLLQAEVPLTNALLLLSAQTKNQKQKNALRQLYGQVSEGRSFAESAAEYKELFDPFAIGMIEVGERVGLLVPNLRHLAGEMEKRHALQRKLFGACLYPAIVLVLMFGITTFLTLYLFPKIMPIFLSMKVTLPWSTQLMLFVSTFLKQRGLMLFLGSVVSSLFLTVWYQKTLAGKRALDTFVLSTPYIGTLARNYFITQSARTLSTMLSSGESLHNSLAFLGKTVGSLTYRDSFTNAACAVGEGKSFAAFLRGNGRTFPELFSGMVEVGEKTSALSETLLHLSMYYENEVEESLKTLTILAEPVLMVGMGLLVGLVALSIITPIYGLTEHLHA